MLSSFKSEPNSRILMFWSIQSRLYTIVLYPMILLKVRVVLMLIGVYNTGILSYEFVVCYCRLFLEGVVENDILNYWNCAFQHF
jgi:hypothetical protein